MLKLKEDIAIKVDKLSKLYQLREEVDDGLGHLTKNHWALKDVSFEVKKGESIGIVGPNGSGKSTLLKILAGITKPTSGSVQIRGRVASILDIGAGFHPELSGRENVYLNGQIHGFSKKEIQCKYADIVAFSGIEKFIDEPVKNYSQGMYLRLAFSIMAHLDFDVYLLDEVLGVGDVTFQEKCKNFFLDQKHQAKTMIIVNHNLFELSKLDCRVIVIKEGQMNHEKDITLAHYLADHLPILERLKKHHYILPKTIDTKLDFRGFTVNEILLNGGNSQKVFLQNKTSIDYHITVKEGEPLLFFLRCYDVAGSYLFSHLTNEEQAFEKGSYLISFKIPTYTFNTNVYTFEMIVFYKDRSFERIKDSICFKVFSSEKDSLLEELEVNKSLFKLQITDECIAVI